MLSCSQPPESFAMSRQAKTLSLSVEEREQLVRIDERGSDWRERRRARTVLLFDQGLSISAMVASQKIHRETVARHRDAWLARGFEGLRDRPRCGAPRKLAETHQEVLCAWAREEAATGLRTKRSLKMVGHAMCLRHSRDTTSTERVAGIRQSAGLGLTAKTLSRQ
jgi:transposase